MHMVRTQSYRTTLPYVVTTIRRIYLRGIDTSFTYRDYVDMKTRIISPYIQLRKAIIMHHTLGTCVCCKVAKACSPVQDCVPGYLPTTRKSTVSEYSHGYVSSMTWYLKQVD
jgi:hypothetical protein